MVPRTIEIRSFLEVSLDSSSISDSERIFPSMKAALTLNLSAIFLEALLRIRKGAIGSSSDVAREVVPFSIESSSLKPTLLIAKRARVFLITV